MTDILLTIFLIFQVINAITLFSIKRAIQKQPKKNNELHEQVMEMMLKLLTLSKDVERIKEEQDK